MKNEDCGKDIMEIIARVSELCGGLKGPNKAHKHFTEKICMMYVAGVTSVAFYDVVAKEIEDYLESGYCTQMSEPLTGKSI